VALNHEEQDVAEFVADVMKHWLARGVDGWRLDAAYAVPTAFWQRVLSEVRAEYPQAYFVGEHIQGDYAHEVVAGQRTPWLCARAMASVRELTRSFLKRLRTWNLTVFSLMLSADASFGYVDRPPGVEGLQVPWWPNSSPRRPLSGQWGRPMGA
jgi:hypothetical protein